MGPEGEEGLGFGEGAVEDGDGVAGFEDVGAHGLAHYAGADPAHSGGGRAYGVDGGGGGGGGGGHGAVERESWGYGSGGDGSGSVGFVAEGRE